MDMWFKATKSWHRKFEPRVRVWKMKEEKPCEEYRCMVRDKVEEAKWKGQGVNDHWQQMKGLMMETAQDICGMSEGPRTRKETWWWNEDVTEAVREKKIMYGEFCSVLFFSRPRSEGWPHHGRTFAASNSMHMPSSCCCLSTLSFLCTSAFSS